MKEIVYNRDDFNVLHGEPILRYGAIFADDDGKIYKVLAVKDEDIKEWVTGSYLIKVNDSGIISYEFLDKPIERLLSTPLLLDVSNGILCQYSDVKGTLTLEYKFLNRGALKRFYPNIEEYKCNEDDLLTIAEFTYTAEKIKWKGLLKEQVLCTQDAGLLSVGDYISYEIDGRDESIFVRIDSIQKGCSNGDYYLIANDHIVSLGQVRRFIQNGDAIWERVD